MLRWILLVMSLGVAAAASLTALRAPTLLTWKVAIVVGEFGHLLLVLPAILGGVGWWQGGALRWPTVAVSALTIALLLKPSAQAFLIGRELPARLEAAFGPARPAVGREAFSVANFAPAAVARVTPETRVFAHAGTPAELKMDFYRASRVGATGAAPCVVVIHGGGWDGGDRTQLPELNHRLARLGYAVAAISYRLAPGARWPAQGDDVVAALAHLKANAAALGIEPAKFVLLGRSAGGQIATAVAYGRPDAAVRGVISLYGPHDLIFAWEFSREDDILNAPRLMRQLLGGTLTEAPENYRSASGYLIVGKNAPPTLMVHGVLDTLVWHKQDERLHAKLDELGVKNVFVSLPWATHACDFNLDGPSGQLTTYAVEHFLAAVTR